MRWRGTETSTSAREGRLALPIAVGLALFLGGDRLVDLAGAPDEDRYLLAVAASVVVRYAGALTVGLCSFTLVRRVLVRTGAGGTTPATSPAPRPRLHDAAFVLLVAGLVLMAVWEARFPVLVYQVNAGDYSAFGGDGTSDVVLQVVLLASGYLGPLVTAVGAYLLLRRLEGAAAGEPPGTSPASGEVVTDLDE